MSRAGWNRCNLLSCLLSWEAVLPITASQMAPGLGCLWPVLACQWQWALSRGSMGVMMLPTA